MAPASPTPERPAVSLRTSLMIVLVSWGIFGSFWWNAWQGVPLTAYARRLGSSEMMVSLIIAACTVGALAQPLSAYLIERTGRRKAIFLATCLVQRPLWVLIGALPYLIPDSYAGWRPVGLLALITASSLLGSAGNPAWLSWMAYIIPQRVRAPFFGSRYRVATITGLLTALLVGRLLDWNSSHAMFLAIFSAAAVMGTVDIAMFCFLPAHDTKPEGTTPSLLEILLIPWRDREFRRYLAYTISGSITYMIIGPFIIIYLLEQAHLGKLATAAYVTVLPLVVAAALGPATGRLVGSFGNRPVILMATVAAMPIPLMYGLAGRDSHGLLLVTAVLVGIVSAATYVPELNMLFSLTPEAKRSAYVSAVSLLAGVVSAGASALGGAIAEACAGWRLVVGGLTLTNLHVVFLAATITRIAHLAIFVPRLPEPTARPLRELMIDVVRGPAQAADGAMRRLRGRNAR